MRSYSPACVPITLLFALALTGCRDKIPAAQAALRAGSPPPSTVRAAMNGLTDEERRDFYHIAEGSEIIPVPWIKALRDPRTNRPFMENPERFGLIADPDPSNRDGLPVGATAAYTVDTRFLRIRMMGFNCAACHVNEITYRGNRLRVDGGPSRFNGDLLRDQLSAAMRATLSNPKRFVLFISDLRRLPAADRQGLEAMGVRTLTDPQVQAFDRLATNRQDDPNEAALLEALETELARDSRANPAIELEEVSFDSADASFLRLQERYADTATVHASERFYQTLSAQSTTAAQTTPRDIIDAIGNAIVIARMLRDRLASLLSMRGGGSGSQHGPGRVDAFGVARNRLYDRDRVPTNAPVSFPHLWDFASVGWLHWDANTNSVMERNLGQALGVGGIYDRHTMKSTMDPVGIFRLEQLARKTTAPAWPAFFPPIDQAKAARGVALFGQYCASCHVNALRDDNCFVVDSVGTDPRRAHNFAAKLGNGRFTDSVALVLRRMRNQAYQTFKVPLDSVDEYNGGLSDAEIVWRTTNTYGVRSLNGVWATAPYLHNGSVPNLYELLLPAPQRSRTFSVGHTEYDPVRVGYTTTPQRFSVTFSTVGIPGNSNSGHDYGTRLSDSERWALVEYLKTLGAYTGPPAAPPPAGHMVRCTALD